MMDLNAGKPVKLSKTGLLNCRCQSACACGVAIFRLERSQEERLVQSSRAIADLVS